MIKYSDVVVAVKVKDTKPKPASEKPVKKGAVNVRR